jgi:hypothetical protein
LLYDTSNEKITTKFGGINFIKMKKAKFLRRASWHLYSWYVPPGMGYRKLTKYTIVKLSPASPAQQQHAYDTITRGESQAHILTNDLRSVSHDGHLGVEYSPQVIPVGNPQGPPSQQVIDEFRQQGVNDNFCFRKLEILEGKGVQPDITIKKEEALRTAHIPALQSIIESSDDIGRKKVLQDIFENLRNYKNH